MNVGDRIIIEHPKHPYHGLAGTISARGGINPQHGEWSYIDLDEPRYTDQDKIGVYHKHMVVTSPQTPSPMQGAEEYEDIMAAQSLMERS